jgi:RHS repeat-associated protein
VTECRRLLYICLETPDLIQCIQAICNATPVSCGLDVTAVGFPTSYSYDTLDNPTAVIQGGVTRSFLFDSLSQLKSAANPESGTTSYNYDLNGNLISKTDQRNITTTYAYDALNRLTGKSYSDGTPAACFQYDSTSTGRLATEWTQAGTCPATVPGSGVLTQRTFASYDAVGRVTTDQQCATPGNCSTGTPNSVSYGYDLAGDMISYSNGLANSPMTFNSSFDNAGRLSSLLGPVNPGNYSSNIGLLTVNGYNAGGAIQDATVGPGITMHRDYNTRLLPVDEVDKVANTPGTANISFSGSDQFSAYSIGTITITEPNSGTADQGTISVLANGTSYQLQYDTTQGATPLALATSIANQFHCWNGTGTVQAAATNGAPPPAAPSATVTLASCSAGPSTTYPYSAAISSHTSSGAPAFNIATAASAMTPTLTGIQPPPPPTAPTLTSTTPVTFTITGVEGQIGSPSNPTYDSGVFLLFIYNSPVNAGPLVAQSVSYGQGSSAFSLASGFATMFQHPCSTPGTLFTAGPAQSTSYNQATFTLSACQSGTVYAPSMVLTYSNKSSFPTPSFSASDIPPSAPYTGLTLPAATYDSGTVTLQVNGTTIASVPYGSTSSGSLIANALSTAGASNSLVTLGYSGSSLSLTAKNLGSYSYTVSMTASFAQPSFTASSTSGSLSGDTNAPLFNWSIGSYAPNGLVLGVTDSVMGTWTHAYDDLNRLIYSQSTAGPLNAQQIFWDYDRYGNRWDQTVNGPQGGVQSHMTFSGNNNRVDGSSYDNAGNQLNGVFYAYTYDAENRIITIGGQPAYTYDASGARVAKIGSGGAPTSIYILGAGSQQITELNGSGQWLHSNAYAGGSLIATYTPSTGGYHYNLTDRLGTKEMQTLPSGNQEETCINDPFGDSLSCTGGADATEQHFTGKDRDGETGLDYFGARYYSSNMARFMTPDWAAAPTSVPYAQFGNPQSLNLYSYVLNNPSSTIDVDGHEGDSPENQYEDAEREGWAGISAMEGAALTQGEPSFGLALSAANPSIPPVVTNVTVSADNGCGGDMDCIIMLNYVLEILIPRVKPAHIAIHAPSKGVQCPNCHKPSQTPVVANNPNTVTCAQLRALYDPLSSWAEGDTVMGILTGKIPPVSTVFFTAAALEGGSAAIVAIPYKYSGLCPK